MVLMLHLHCALQTCNVAHMQSATSERVASKTRVNQIFCPWLIKYGGKSRFSPSNSVVNLQVTGHSYQLAYCIEICMQFGLWLAGSACSHRVTLPRILLSQWNYNVYLSQTQKVPFLVMESKRASVLYLYSTRGYPLQRVWLNLDCF